MAVHIFLSPEIFISIFEFSDPENPTVHANIVSIALPELKSGILVYSYIILVAMATPLARSKMQVTYLNSITPYLHVKKILDLLQGIEICAILAFFAQIWLPWQLPQLR